MAEGLRQRHDTTRAITGAGDLARADDWVVSPITLRHGCSIGAGAVVVAGTDVGRFATVGRRNRHARRPRPRARRREPGPPHRMGLLRRPARGRRVPGRCHPRGRYDVPIVSHDLRHHRRPMRRRLTSPEEPMIPISRPTAKRRRMPSCRSSGQGVLAMGRRPRLRGGLGRVLRRRHAVLIDQRHRRPGSLVLDALGIGPGDGHHGLVDFNATVSVILRAGATPVLVDIREDDFCMDEAEVEAAITPRTKAIMPAPPLRPDRRRPAGRDRRAPRPRDHRGRRAGPRGRIPRQRAVRPGDVQPLRHQEPHDR